MSKNNKLTKAQVKNIEQHRKFAPYYDTIFKNVPNIEFYKRYARKTKGPILELACGTGRLSIPLAQLGYQVHGLDLSKDMLNMFRKKISQNSRLKNSITLHQGNLGNFKINTKFALIFISNSSFLFLNTDHKKLKALNCIYDHLKAKGLCIIENFPYKRSIPYTEMKELKLPKNIRAWCKVNILKTKSQDTFKIVKLSKNKKMNIKYVLDVWPVAVKRMIEIAKLSKFKTVKYIAPKRGTEKIFQLNARDVFLFQKYK